MGGGRIRAVCGPAACLTSPSTRTPKVVSQLRRAVHWSPVTSDVMSQSEAPTLGVTSRKGYWILVALAPLSVLTADTGGPPILVYAFFAFAAVASVRLVRTSPSRVQKGIAVALALMYGAALLLALYMPLKYSYGFFGGAH
jgi:hypothetical protein